MDKNKISAFNKMTSKKLTMKQIYKDFKLRYDVREARRFLELSKSTPKTEVNKALRNYTGSSWRGSLFSHADTTKLHN